jgi:hypothetical protein
MASDPENHAQLNQLIAELEPMEWRATVMPHATADIVCLRIERPSTTPGAGQQAIELCRRRLDDAVKSARIHIFKQR